MSTTLTATAAPVTTRRERASVTPIPFARLMKVELRKMLDTRAGFWLLAAIGIITVLASAAVILWAPEEEITLETFGTAMGIPMSIILPMIAVLSVTSEYSQRTGLTTFTLVPWRSRVIASKLAVVVGLGVASMLLSLAVGAVGNVLGAAIIGTDPVWDMSVQQFSFIVLANVMFMLMGFMLGVLIRNSPGAIVSYFVYALVLPGALGALAAFQQWYADLSPWVDVNVAIGPLFEGSVSAEQWAQLGVTSLIWLWVPLAIGLRIVLRSEVK